ncbi:hypothetical protein MCOR26_007712, partial [Pyricularia oryzae]
DHNIPKVHIFGRVIRGLDAGYAATDADKYGHAEARKRPKHWARDTTRVDVTGHFWRASYDDDIVTGKHSARVHVLVVGGIVVERIMLLVEHRSRRQQFEVGYWPLGAAAQSVFVIANNGP